MCDLLNYSDNNNILGMFLLVDFVKAFDSVLWKPLILGKMVRRDNTLKGVTVDGSEYRLSQYADDTVFILDGSENWLSRAFKLLDDFAWMSGLKVNISKTL